LNLRVHTQCTRGQRHWTTLATRALRPKVAISRTFRNGMPQADCGRAGPNPGSGMRTKTPQEWGSTRCRSGSAQWRAPLSRTDLV
jgi:hypothetical protein